MIRKLLALVALAGAVWWLLTRRDERREATVVIGYGDGSAVTVTGDVPQRERLLEVARGVVRG